MGGLGWSERFHSRPVLKILDLGWYVRIGVCTGRKLHTVRTVAVRTAELFATACLLP